jgi:hypothetical protein
MAMTPLHRFARRQLWRLAGALVALVFAGRVLGPGAAWRIVEWTPMTVALVLVAAYVAGTVRGLHHARARRRRP